MHNNPALVCAKLRVVADLAAMGMTTRQVGYNPALAFGAKFFFFFLALGLRTE